MQPGKKPEQPYYKKILGLCRRLNQIEKTFNRVHFEPVNPIHGVA